MIQMTRRWAVIITGGLVMTAAASGALHAAGGVGQPARSSESSTAWQRGLLDRYCVTCHNDRLRTGGLALDGLNVAHVAEDLEAWEVWEKVVRKLRAGMMPPAGRPRPDAVGHTRFVTWLEGELDRAAQARPYPGRIDTFHRLNRAEYVNVIRDVLALDVDAASLLPADDADHGFDNVAGVLGISESVLDRYLSAARRISREALGAVPPDLITAIYRAEEEGRQYGHVEGLPFGTRGGILAQHQFPQDGEYLIRVELICRRSDGCDGSAGFRDRHELEMLIDNQRVQAWTLEPKAPPASALEGLVAPALELVVNPKFEVRLPVKAGPRNVGATFVKHPSYYEIRSVTRDFLKPSYDRDIGVGRDGNIYQPFVDRITIVGPFDPSGPGDTPSRRRIFVCQPAAASEDATCARTILSTVARRAYRRAVNDADLEPLMAFYERGRAEGGFEAGIELAIRRMLVSPKFLFRTVAQPAHVSPSEVFRISDLEFASRLAFFLWSSIPDDDLLDIAIQGTLRQPAILEREVRRMLADPRSEALTKNFAGQWLQLRNLAAKRPDGLQYPDFDDSLRQALGRETELFFDSVVREDRGAMDLLTANYTFLNERLATHYGIPNVKGTHFRRVTLSDDSPRRGLLGQGSVLTVTSHPNRVSPVLRGKWILENIIGIRPPDPPADVPALPERPPGGEKIKAPSLRDRMVEHRANPVCAACHNMIDPPGFALSNFDAIGKWQDVDESYRLLDTSAAMPDGTSFEDLAGFRALLESRPERFVTTLTEKLLIYASGRGLEFYDAPVVRQIVRDAAASRYRISELIIGIVKSPTVQMSSAERGPATGVIAGQ